MSISFKVHAYKLNIWFSQNHPNISHLHLCIWQKRDGSKDLNYKIYNSVTQKILNEHKCVLNKHKEINITFGFT